MNNEDILQSDLLDIVFDNRNKAYGAYELRKHYKRRLVKSLLVAFIFAGGAVALTFLAKEEKLLNTKIIFDGPEPVTLAPVEPQKKPELPKQTEAPKPAASKQDVKRDNFTNIVITKNESEADKLATNLDNAAISNKTSGGTEPYKGEVFVPEPVKIDAGGKEVAAPTINRDDPMRSPDVMPAYPGGMKELRKFLERNLKSFDDLEQGKVVSVKITFVVGYDGKLKGFQVLEDGGDMYNKEVIRVLKKMPEWIPGKANGENVSVYYTIPVKFTSAE